MKDQTKIILAEVFMILMALCLGFVIAGAYYTTNLNDNREMYGLQLEHVLKTCKEAYHQKIALLEEDTKLSVILMEDTP